MNCNFTKSFFDDSKPAESFWIKRALQVDQNKVECQCLLFKKSHKTGFWVSRNYLIYESQLIKVKCNSKNFHIINLNLSRIQKLKYKNKLEKECINKKKYGFRIIRNNQYRELYSRSKELNQILWEKLKKQAILTTFKDDFSLQKIVGKGNFAKVYTCIRKENQKLQATKVYEKNKIKNSETDRSALQKEMIILRKISHKGLIRMYEVYEDENLIYFIMDYLEGGELSNHISKNLKFPEKLVAKMIATLLDSLDYLQKQNILHRDIKPDNLIMRTKGVLDDIVIADFGLADFYNPFGNYMFCRCGTPGFVAPELLQDKIYDFKIDVFSVGCLMYLLCTGKNPFKGSGYDEIVMKNYNCKIDYLSIENDISSEGLQFLKQLLHPKPQYRPNARLALKHKWFMLNLDQSRYKELNNDMSETKESTIKSSLTEIPFIKFLNSNMNNNSLTEFYTPEQKDMNKKEFKLFTPQLMQQIDESQDDNLNSIKIINNYDDTDLVIDDDSPQSHKLPHYQIMSKLKQVVDSKNSSLYASPIILNTPEIVTRKLMDKDKKEIQVQNGKLAYQVMNNLKNLESQQ